MADPVAIAQMIIDIAVKINDAVEKVRENKEECRGIQKLVCRVSDLLSLLKESEMMKHQAVGGPLDDLGDAVSRAREVVTACQGRCIFCKARKLSKKLSQVKNDISQGIMLAIFATHAAAVFVATKGQQSASNFNVFIIRTHQQTPPLSEHRSSSPRAVTEDFPVTVLTNEPYRSPDAVVSNVPNPCLPTQTQESPALAPIITNDVPDDLEPPSDVHISPVPHSHPHTTVDPIESKHLCSRPPKQPPSPPPHKTSFIPTPAAPPPIPPSSLSLPTNVTSAPIPPSSLSLPTNVTSAASKHPTHRRTTRPPLPSPSPAPSDPVIASTNAQNPGSLPRPSTLVPPGSPLQSTMEVSLPVTSSESTALPEDASTISDERRNKSGQADGPSTLLPGLRKFSLSELKDATNNFSEKNKIGSSDFGIFYKGVLHDGLKVTIKKFQNPPQFLLGGLSAKLRLASKLQSKDVKASGNNMNIIRVLGYGHELKLPTLETHIFLVEEYLPNGKMYSIIYEKYQLRWTSRFRILLGIAQGLQYLHEENIVHMNVKPASVLLDSDMNPKITGFGIARLLEKQIIQDNNIVGTVGYMAPEYILEGTLSTKYDVYSFGVTLLETISSMCNTNPAHHHFSVPWAWNVHDYQNMGELFDPSLFEDSQLPEIKKCLKIGLLCTQFESAKRPTMVSVLEMLNGKKKLTTPRQPEYTKGRVIYAKGSSHKVRSRGR